MVWKVALNSRNVSEEDMGVFNLSWRSLIDVDDRTL